MNQYPEVWAQLLALRARGFKSCDKAYQDLYGGPTGHLYWHDPAKAKAKARKPVSTDPRDTFRPNVYCDLIGDDAEVVVGGAMAAFDIRPALADVRVPTFLQRR